MNFIEKWIDLLTQDKKDKIEEFEKIRSSSKSVQLAIMEYRRKESNRGRGSDITEINDTESLQELFLEPITLQDIQCLHKKLKGLKMDVAEGYNRIYELHLNNVNKRFIYLVNSL